MQEIKFLLFLQVFYQPDLALIFESVNLYKQKSFFKSYDDYSYTHLEYKINGNSDGSVADRFERNAIVQETFYRRFFKKFDATLLTNISNILNEEGILANRNAFDYLSSNIKEGFCI